MSHSLSFHLRFVCIGALVGLAANAFAASEEQVQQMQLNLRQSPAEKMKSLRDKRQNIEVEIRGLKRQLKAMETKSTREKNQGSCDACLSVAQRYCNPTKLDEHLNWDLHVPEACATGACKVDVNPKEDICHRIYQNENCYMVLPLSARSKVDKCWKVENALKMQKLQEDLKELQESLADLKKQEQDKELDSPFEQVRDFQSKVEEENKENKEAPVKPLPTRRNTEKKAGESHQNVK